ARVPRRRDPGEPALLRRLQLRRPAATVPQHLRADRPRLRPARVARDIDPTEEVAMATFRARLAPYLLVLPAGLCLLLFFVVPMVAMLSLSLMEGDVVNGDVLTFRWETYAEVIENYRGQIIRSLWY